MGPLLLKPNYIAPVWSGPRVNEARGLDGQELFGESFDVSVHDGLVNAIDGGAYDGVPLDRVLNAFRAEIMGDAATQGGIIQVITMDAGENLSVQIHPDEAYARAVEGDQEKSESWYILEADPGAAIICGTTTDDVAVLRAAAEDDSIAERFGRRVPVQEGDFVLLTAGTMHALNK